MIRCILIIIGFFVLYIHRYIQPFSVQLQFIIFLAGIVLIGIPHGAADFLVASQNADIRERIFSKLRFFINYLGRLFLFAAVLWFFPIAGIVLFIFFAAYHFGETDLYQFKIDTIAGNIFVVSYGLTILGIILLHHFEEVKPILLLLDNNLKDSAFVSWLEDYRYVALSFIGLFFFITTFLYFLISSPFRYNDGKFLVNFALILFILYNLPLVLGFTFYFIIWHSVLTLGNIIVYLHKDNLLTSSMIVKQIGLYSFLAIAGISIFGIFGFMFSTNDMMILYIFLGLAVLTVPHMQIMHDMYNSIRYNSKTGKQI